MASKLTEERVQALAKHYCTNGYIKSVALQSVGYSKNYSQHNGLKLFDKDRVKQAMAKEMQELAEKTAITIKLQQQRHARLARLAEEKGDLATATRNEELIGKTIGAYIDRTQQDNEQVRELSETETRELKRIAAIRLRQGTG